jgi:hypothetical protein
LRTILGAYLSTASTDADKDPPLFRTLGPQSQERITTKLYDRRNDQKTLDQVERVVLLKSGHGLAVTSQKR